MNLRRWDEFKHEYMPYEVPDDWHVTIYETDMQTPVNCAQCGRELPFGRTYTSTQVQTLFGFGYAVCGDCYFGKEIPERLRARASHDA